MKKTALSLFHSLLCIISATAQAPGALIELSDSIVFEERQGYLFKNGRGICAFDAAKGLIRHYDTELVLLYTVTIDTAYLAKERGNFHNAIVYETGDKIVLLNTTKYKLDLFNKSGKYLYSKKLALKYKGQQYFINNNFPPYDPVTSGNTLLLALKQEWEGYDGSNAEFLKGGQKRYEQSGIIGEVDMDGKLLNVFGRYDTAYRRGRLLTYLDGYSFGWIGSDSVFVSFQLGDRVAIYHKGLEKSPVATRGAHFNKNLQDLFAVTGREDVLENNPKHPIETPHYFDCAVVADRYLVRTYAIAVQDTIQFTPQEIETRQKWLSGEIKGCRIKTKHDYEQTREYRLKPCFVQIFDLAHPTALLYDGPIPVRFPMCLGMGREGEFLFTSYFRAEHGEADHQVVYRFRLKMGEGVE